MSSARRSPDSESYPNWKDLPTGLLAEIARRLTSITDYMAFRRICRSWRSAASFDNFDRAFPRVPWLMRVAGEQEGKGTHCRDVKIVANFLDLSSEKICRIVNFPPASGMRYVSWSGWILYVSNKGKGVNLTHPVWPIQIKLPSLVTFPLYIDKGTIPTYLINKMVLSSSPTLKTDLVVMVVWGPGRLGFSRPGDSSWTVMAPWDRPFGDIVYHNRRLYAVDVNGRVVQCDIHGSNPTQILQVFSLPSHENVANLASKETCYLVESSGKFLIVSRKLTYLETVKFRIFEFDLMDASHKEIHNLGNRALFVGFNSSLCLELSGWEMVKPNCIYFADHYGQRMSSDTGVYCLANKKIKVLSGAFAGTFFAPPTWVVPSF